MEQRMDTPLGSESLEEALQQVELAKQRAEEIRLQNYQKAVDQIKAMIAMYAISPKDLGFGSAEGERKSRPGDRRDLRHEVKPKYKGPNGEVWAGRGKTPAWVSKHIMAGGKIEDLLISKEKEGTA
jgi:DNA-binding protein H-NS